MRLSIMPSPAAVIELPLRDCPLGMPTSPLSNTVHSGRRGWRPLTWPPAHANLGAVLIWMW
jgi:hypothetical protein